LMILYTNLFKINGNLQSGIFLVIIYLYLKKYILLLFKFIQYIFHLSFIVKF